MMAASRAGPSVRETSDLRSRLCSLTARVRTLKTSACNHHAASTSATISPALIAQSGSQETRRSEEGGKSREFIHGTFGKYWGKTQFSSALTSPSGDGFLTATRTRISVTAARFRVRPMHFFPLGHEGWRAEKRSPVWCPRSVSRSRRAPSGAPQRRLWSASGPAFVLAVATTRSSSEAVAQPKRQSAPDRDP
jgi:hypothetical protein